MNERDLILQDIESNLLPLVVRYAKVYASRDSVESEKALKKMQTWLTNGIHRHQPLPEMGDDDA